MKYNERKRDVLNISRRGGVTINYVENRLFLNHYTAVALMRNYTKWRLFRKYRKKGGENIYYITEKGKRISDALNAIPEGAPLKLIRPYHRYWLCKESKKQ